MNLTLEDRPQTLGEEIANAVSHGLGFVLAIASLPILVVMAARLETRKGHEYLFQAVKRVMVRHPDMRVLDGISLAIEPGQLIH